MEYEAEGSRTTDRLKRTWREVVQTDCQVHKLNRKDSMDHSRWKKLIKDGLIMIDVSGLMFLFILAHPGSPEQLFFVLVVVVVLSDLK